MKIPIWSKASATVKQTALGGAIAGAVVGLESGVSWFVAGYPQILKDKIIPQMPRNGALIADLVPAGYAIMVKRKRSSEKAENRANGMLFYDLPKLLDQFVYNIAYEMGRPAPVAGLRNSGLRLNTSLRMSRPPMVNGIATTSYAKVGSGAGKYTMKTGATKTALAGGIGKYR